MANTLNLGKVTDFITSVERISGTGQAGSTDTYRMKSESGFTKDFNIVNGKDGISGLQYRRLLWAHPTGGSTITESDKNTFISVLKSISSDLISRGVKTWGDSLKPVNYLFIASGRDITYMTTDIEIDHDIYYNTEENDDTLKKFKIGDWIKGDIYFTDHEEWTIQNISGECLKTTSSYTYYIYLYVLEPTEVSQKVQDFVDIASTQTITGNKIFDADVYLNGGSTLYVDKIEGFNVTDIDVNGLLNIVDGVKTDNINNTNGNAMLRYKPTENKIVLGGSTIPTTIMGSGDRPTYSKNGSDFTGNELALKSDVDSNWSLLMANLGVGRWSNQTICDFPWGGSGNFYDSLAPYYTSYVRMFSYSKFNSSEDIILQNDYTSGGNATYMFYACPAKGTLKFKNIKLNDVTFLCMKSSFTRILIEDNASCVLGNNLSNAFADCPNLVEIGDFDVSKVNYSFFDLIRNSPKVKRIGFKHITKSINISPSTAFEEADLVEIISNLDEVATTQTLTMGATNLAKLTDEEKKVATDKGWILA